MFCRERDASKVALVHLVARLKRGGFRLLDTQFTTEHLKQFGAIDVDRRQYQRLLEQAIAARPISTGLAAARRVRRGPAVGQPDVVDGVVDGVQAGARRRTSSP